MNTAVLAFAIEVLLCAGMLTLRARRKRARRREAERFAAAAAQARRLAHNALIVEASVAELAELVIEESLRDMGMDWIAEPF